MAEVASEGSEGRQACCHSSRCQQQEGVAPGLVVADFGSVLPTAGQEDHYQEHQADTPVDAHPVAEARRPDWVDQRLAGL